MKKTIHDDRYRRAIARLREARLGCGLRQADVAHTIGVNRTMIVGIETFERRADLLEIHEIARVYGLRLSDLEPLLEEGGTDESCP
jgi:DNA-binding XRE family transcriptional regulator